MERGRDWEVENHVVAAVDIFVSDYCCLYFYAAGVTVIVLEKKMSVHVDEGTVVIYICVLM